MVKMRSTAPPNLTRYWRDEDLPGLSLLRADLTGQDFPPHVHEALVVVITEEGGAHVRCGGRDEEAKPASLLVCNPGEPHSGSMADSPLWRYRGFYFEARALEELRTMLGLPGQPYFERAALDDANLANAFVALHKSMELPGADPFHRGEMLASAMGFLYERHSNSRSAGLATGRNRCLLERAREMFQQRHGEPLLLSDVAEALGLTPFRLITLFKREFGLTPYALLTQIRLNAACSLMKRGLPIAECASAAGFYDQAALTKHFKARFAVTPAQYAVASS